MDDNTIYFSQKELNYIKQIKNSNEIKKQRNQNFFLSVLWLITLIFEIVRIFINFNEKNWTALAICIITLVIKICFLITTFKAFFSAYIFNIKYEILCNEELNPYLAEWKKQIETFKELIQNGESFYTVNTHYISLRNFLKENGVFLPKEIYSKAYKELETISSEMVNCKLK